MYSKCFRNQRKTHFMDTSVLSTKSHTENKCLFLWRMSRLKSEAPGKNCLVKCFYLEISKREKLQSQIAKYTK